MHDFSSFDIIEYLENLGISYSTHGKNISENWVGTNCPFCDDQSNHLGININSKVFSCFRCGTKGSIPKLIMALENINFSKAIIITDKFNKRERIQYSHSISKTELKNVEQYFFHESTELTDYHKQYLENRKFDPEYLEKTYKLRSAKPTSEYSHRILIPYFYQDKMVTFSSRDVSGKAEIKYLHCPITKSVIHVKEMLYNADTVKDACLCVEGTTDCFRIGLGSVALSGIQFTRKQMLTLSKFKRIFILADPEPEAQKMALLLANDLSFCAGTVEILKLDIDVDPGNMEEDDVKCLRKEIFGKIY